MDRFGPPVKIVRPAIQAVVQDARLGDLSTLDDHTALEGLKSVVAESKLQELRNEVRNRNRAFAIWLGRVQAGEGSHFWGCIVRLVHSPQGAGYPSRSLIVKATRVDPVPGSSASFAVVNVV